MTESPQQKPVPVNGPTFYSNIESALVALQELCWSTSESKGFHDDHPNRDDFVPGARGDKAYVSAYRDHHANKMMLIVSEATEAHDALRDGWDVDHTYYDDAKPGKPEGVPSEIADGVIRAFDYAGIAGFDLGAIIMEKIAYNATRPAMHGRQF